MSHLVGHLNRLEILHGQVVVLEITAFIICIGDFSYGQSMNLNLTFLLLLILVSPSPLLLEWDISEDVLFIPLSAIKLAFIVVIASDVDVEVSRAMISLHLAFSDLMVVLSALLVANFALQHGSNMECL